MRLIIWINSNVSWAVILVVFRQQHRQQHWTRLLCVKVKVIQWVIFWPTSKQFITWLQFNLYNNPLKALATQIAKFTQIKCQNCNACFHVILIAIQQLLLQPQLSLQRQFPWRLRPQLLQILVTIYATTSVTRLMTIILEPIVKSIATLVVWRLQYRQQQRQLLLRYVSMIVMITAMKIFQIFTLAL